MGDILRRNREMGIGVASDDRPPVWPFVHVSGTDLGNQWRISFTLHTHISQGGRFPFWGLGHYNKTKCVVSGWDMA